MPPRVAKESATESDQAPAGRTLSGHAQGRAGASEILDQEGLDRGGLLKPAAVEVHAFHAGLGAH